MKERKLKIGAFAGQDLRLVPLCELSKEGLEDYVVILEIMLAKGKDVEQKLRAARAELEAR